MINEILMNIHSSEDIKNSFKSYENFLISLSNQFVYFLNNNIKINDVFIDNFKFYLNEYNLYINTNVLEFLNNLYQICKKYDYDDLLFIGEILKEI